MWHGGTTSKVFPWEKPCWGAAEQRGKGRKVGVLPSPWTAVFAMAPTPQWAALLVVSPLNFCLWLMSHSPSHPPLLLLPHTSIRLQIGKTIFETSSIFTGWDISPPPNFIPDKCIYITWPPGPEFGGYSDQFQTCQKLWGSGCALPLLILPLLHSSNAHAIRTFHFQGLKVKTLFVQRINWNCVCARMW